MTTLQPKDVENLTKEDVLTQIKKEMAVFQRGETQKNYKKLYGLISEIDMSVVESVDENEQSSSPPKRRKSNRTASESKEASLKQKNKEEIKKQIKIVQQALSVVYDMTNSNIKKFLLKNGEKHRHVISRIDFIRKLNESGLAIPLFVSIDGEKPPPLCGAIPADKSHIAEVGDLIAAMIQPGEAENWILAAVAAYNPVKKEYKIDDIYEEQVEEQLVSRNNTIPLPNMRADPDIHPEALFPKNQEVLALYPGTTCFYPAIVSKPPESTLEPYDLCFEDETYPSGYSAPVSVHQRYVIHLP